MAEATQSQSVGGILDRLADPVLALTFVLMAAIFLPGAILPIVLIFSLVILVARRDSLLSFFKAPAPGLLAVIIMAGWFVATIAWTIAPDATPTAVGAMAAACVLGGLAAVLTARGAPPPPTHWAITVIAFGAVVLVIFNAASGWTFGVGGALVALLPVLIFPVAAALRTRFGLGEAILWIVIAFALCAWIGGFAPLIAVAVGMFAFLMGGLSAIAGRILLTLILLVLGVLLPLSAFLVGDALISVSQDVFGAGNALEARLGGWVDVVAAWRDTALLGLGAAAVPVSGGGGGYLRLLAETGFIGLALTAIALGVVIWTGVPRAAEDDKTWRTPASAGTIGAVLTLGVGYAGIWSTWWLGGLVLAAMILGACRPRPAGGASLGSIFDFARDDETVGAEDDLPPADEWNVDPDAVDERPDGPGDEFRDEFDDEPDAWEIEDADETRQQGEEESFSFDRLDPSGDGRKT